MELKRARVVRLSTEDKTCIGKTVIGTLLYVPKGMIVKTPVIYQHLYFITNEDIKEGDWFTDGIKVYRNTTQLDGYIGFKKIIASTDPKLCSLKQNRNLGQAIIPLPSPSQAFIEKYVKLGGIDEVDVEYKRWVEPNLLDMKSKVNYKLKVNSHNEITIHSIKSSWTREELQIFKTSDGHNFLSFIRQRMLTIHNENPNYDYMIKLKELEKFVDNNL